MVKRQYNVQAKNVVVYLSNRCRCMNISEFCFKRLRSNGDLYWMSLGVT